VTGKEVEALRHAEFPYVSGSAYLNAASAGPLPERTRRAVEAFNLRRSRIHQLDEADFSEPLHRCRAAAARLIGADVEEIALGGNTSFGINLAALGLPLERGTTIVTSEGEFPANVYPWMAQEERGVRCELVPAGDGGLPDEEALLARLKAGDVSVLALSSVQFGNGYRADLARFGAECRQRGIFFVVDAIQSLGHLPIDVAALGIDVLATGGHKWLCGPFGTGFAYVRRELQDALAPRVIGWQAMRACRDIARLTDYRWGFVSGARRYEVATPPFQDMVGLAHSLELLLEVGVARIERYVGTLLDRFLDWLGAQPAVEIVSDLRTEHRSGILAFRAPQPEQLFDRLEAAGVLCAYREGAIRVSPHFYNTWGDIERLIEVLDAEEWAERSGRHG
jgi:cysteine desulfurase / selenocysteine lyase